jgi:hypothetical protein
VYFLIYSAHPNGGTEDYVRFEGAHVACWIDVEDIELARSKAQKMIRNREWTVENLEEEHSITREIAETSTGLQYYEQALIDGEVLVFVTSPRGEI